jgi:hypothetical protein
VEKLIERFQLVKNRNPLHANELLDYIQKSYIFGELTIVEYKTLFYELHKAGAEKPSCFFINSRSFDFENSALNSTGS